MNDTRTLSSWIGIAVGATIVLGCIIATVLIVVSFGGIPPV